MAEKRVSINTFEAFMGVHCQYIPDGTGHVSVNLVGSDKDSLVVFHHDARANWKGKDVLVLNTKINGIWQREVRPSGFPFMPGVNTAVTALCGPGNQILVFANSDLIANYQVPPGVDYSSIKSILVLASENQSPDVGTVAIGRALAVPDPMKEGDTVTMTAVVPTDLSPGTFTMELLKEPLPRYPTSDILLHINPCDTNIIFNTKIGGHWQRAETVPNTHFCPGANFSIVIVARVDSYEIRVDGELVHTFKYRSQDKPQYAVIQGVSTLDNIQYHQLGEPTNEECGVTNSPTSSESVPHQSVLNPPVRRSQRNIKKPDRYMDSWTSTK